jgi:hypothetical protein
MLLIGQRILRDISPILFLIVAISGALGCSGLSCLQSFALLSDSLHFWPAFRQKAGAYFYLLNLKTNCGAAHRVRFEIESPAECALRLLRFQFQNM